MTDRFAEQRVVFREAVVVAMGMLRAWSSFDSAGSQKAVSLFNTVNWPLSMDEGRDEPSREFKGWAADVRFAIVMQLIEAGSNALIGALKAGVELPDRRELFGLHSMDDIPQPESNQLAFDLFRAYTLAEDVDFINEAQPLWDRVESDPMMRNKVVMHLTHLACRLVKQQADAQGAEVSAAFDELETRLLTPLADHPGDDDAE